MSEKHEIALPEPRRKGVSRGVAVALAFCFFGIGVGAKAALTPSFSMPSGSTVGNLSSGIGMPGGMPGGAMPGGGMPALKGTVTDVMSDSYTIKTEMGVSVTVPLDSGSTVKVGDTRELKIK